MSQPAANKSAAEMIIGYFRDFRVLKETRKEYWGIQIINFLDNTAYFAMLTVASLFLSEDLGLDDDQAGWAITVFTSATTLMLFLSGMCTDWLGIKKSLNLSMTAMAVLRGAMVVVGTVPSLPNRGIIAAVLLFLMAPFMAGIQTAFQASCQRFTTRRSRSAGFNLWYLFMNIGAAAGGAAIDIVRIWLGLPNVHIFTLGVITSLLCLITGMLMIRREDQLVGADETVEEKTETGAAPKKSPLTILGEVIRESALWRLLVLIALILGVRAVFTYMYLLMPKYWVRTMGPDAQIGLLNMINPIGIIIGLILFIPITNKFKVFNMLIYGAIISSLALFPMAMPWTMFSPDIANAHYIMAILCMAILTLGEVIWSPKLNEYTAAIAPKGQEGTYLGFSLMPWFLAKTMVSYYSGRLLQRWSPASLDFSATKIAENAQPLGYNAHQLGSALSPGEIVEQSTSVGAPLAEAVKNLDLAAVTAQAQKLGIDAAQFLKDFKPEQFKVTLQNFKIDPESVKSADLPAVALKIKTMAVEISQNILSGHTASDTVSVSLQFAMQNHWVEYWNSPAAMWLLLACYALAGCIVALLLRNWLTRGANWKASHHK